MRSLQVLHEHLTDYIEDEMRLLDVTNPTTAAVLPVLTKMCEERYETEEALEQEHRGLEKEEQEEFLVTRTVGSTEVQQELELWRPAIEKEWKSLIQETQAVKQITREELRRLSEERGQTVEILPAKMVCTRKAGTGLRRARAVCCGNYQTSSEEGSTYAGGVDSVTVRTALRWGALQGWTAAVLDIKTAFLNAPRTSASIIATEVPGVMRQLQLADTDQIWLIVGALYGLTTSPRDWQLCRDARLPEIRWQQSDEDGKIQECWMKKTAEDNLWLIKRGQGTVGMVLVYVDDFLFLGATMVVEEAVYKAVSTAWTCSPPTFVTEKDPVTFCGIEIRRHKESQGFELTQQAYEQELLERWPQEKSSPQVQLRAPAPDAEDESDATAEEIKEAQALREHFCG